MDNLFFRHFQKNELNDVGKLLKIKLLKKNP